MNPPKASLLIIFLVVFVDLLGFGIVIPILPYYAQQYGASGWELGWLMTSYSLMQFLCAPLWGRLSDRIGRRPVLLASILGTGLSMVLLGFAKSLEWLFIGRILAGVCGANISTAYAYITDVTTEKDRAKGMGLIGAGFGLGFVFGPALGGILSHWGYSLPMFAGATLSLINLTFAWFKLAEPPIPAEVRSANRVKRFDLAGIRRTLSSPRTRFAILCFFLLTVAVTQMEVTFAIFMGAKFGYDAQEAGMLLAAMGIIMAGVQGGLIGKLARTFGEMRLITVGLAVCAVALTLFASGSTVQWVVFSLLFLALGHGVLHPSLSSLASKGAGIQERGATMGVFQSAGSLSRIVGPPAAGYLYDQISHGAPFYGGAVILALALLLVWSPLAPRT